MKTNVNDSDFWVNLCYDLHERAKRAHERGDMELFEKLRAQHILVTNRAQDSLTCEIGGLRDELIEKCDIAIDSFALSKHRGAILSISALSLIGLVALVSGVAGVNVFRIYVGAALICVSSFFGGVFYVFHKIGSTNDER